jgi:O-methyltransferase
VGLKPEDKVAALCARIEELKAQLAEVKAQRDDARKQRNLAFARCDTLGEENGMLQAKCDLLGSSIRDLESRMSSDFQAEEDQFRAWCAGMGRPDFFSDALAAWVRNMDAMRSPEFRRAYERGMNSGHILGRARGTHDLQIEWRIHIALWAATHAKSLAGDFVECGVNTGIVSIAICTYLDFNSLDKDFYLFDTFQGIPEEQMSEVERDERIRHNKSHYTECYETAVKNFASWPRCRLVRGKVPDTLAEVGIEKVAYLHIDMNIAAPERAALEFFWDKVVPGGVILLDDYGFSAFRPQYESANEFAQGKGVMIATLPTGQGLLIKR